MSETKLYLIKSDYRSPNKNKPIGKGEKAFHNYKKDTYTWGTPYDVSDSNVKFGEMILVTEKFGKFIIPRGHLAELSEEQTKYVLNMVEPKSNANDEITPTIETLNERGQEAVKEGTDKIKEVSIEKIKNLKNSFVSTGVVFGAIGGVGLAMWLRKGAVVTTVLIAGGIVAGGLLGNHFQKKYDKKDETD